MEAPLVVTKMYIPRARRRLVTRPRLSHRLDAVLKSSLALISAPPGFGKTTLVTDWIAAHADRCSVAWLSLDERDNEPAGFWMYVISALQVPMPNIGSDAMSMLRSEPSQAIETVLTALINDVAGCGGDVVLVLDDYHVVARFEIHEGLTFLLDHLPPNLHLVVSSRADPPLPLARLRARGELIEIRAADLRFLPAEAEAYFRDVMSLPLSDSDLAALEGRTEGWIAALQLAALSLQGRDDVGGFIENFAGDDRYIVDYLVEEVLQRQEPGVREFLLETAILDRLTGDLCETVTGRPGGTATLQGLEQQNLFVVPLDDRRMWYRYHHLFADVLRLRLASEGIERVRDLHDRASRWFAEHAEPAEGIRHALAAHNFDRAAGLIETVIQDMHRSRQDTTLRGWFEALPDDILARRPVLSVGFVGLLLQTGEVERVDDLLEDAENASAVAVHVRIDEQGPTDVPAFVDESQFVELPGMIALYRAGASQVRGKTDDTVKYARLALERMADDAALRGGALALLGLALWTRGDLEEAYTTYAEGVAKVHAQGYVNDSSTIMLADMLVAQGRLQDALAVYRTSLRVAGAPDSKVQRGTADQHVGISEVLRELGDLDAAAEHLATSRSLGDAAGLPENRYRQFTAMAALRQSTGSPTEGLGLLDEAERFYAPGFSPDARPISALRARVWIALGRLDEAERWARQRGLALSGELSYLREFEYITLARLLLARARVDQAGPHADEALVLLDRLAASATEGGRAGSLIEVLVLKALALDARGNRPEALEVLGRALERAVAEGFVRVFLDEGAPMRALLDVIAKRTPGSYAGRLLASAHSSAPVRNGSSPGQDQLSDRELEVVRLLGTDLTGPEIAKELVVSLNTVRTHTRNIYTKLGVTTRRAAVRRAGELHLL